MDRVLSQQEKIWLAKAKLTPKAEQVISETWAELPEPPPKPKVKAFIGSVIGMCLLPALIFILGANSFHWAAIQKGYENIATLVVWLLYIFLFPLVSLMNYSTADVKSRPSVFSHTNIRLLVGEFSILRIYARSMVLLLIGVLAFRGSMMTAVMLLFAWGLSMLFNVALKGKVLEAVKALG